mmetsp:Transcript_6163/g.14958  ORF Transcript_6163/g.14958 Transcript_6163/m.14958 type:complete len:228 (+) Transcript_6163:258-941(+)
MARLLHSSNRCLRGLVRVQNLLKEWFHRSIVGFGRLYRDGDQQASRASRGSLSKTENSPKVCLGLDGSRLYIVEKVGLFLGYRSQHLALNPLLGGNLGLGENRGLGHLVHRPKGTQRGKIVACGSVGNKHERLLVRFRFEIQNNLAAIRQGLFRHDPFTRDINLEFAVRVLVLSQRDLGPANVRIDQQRRGSGHDACDRRCETPSASFWALHRKSADMSRQRQCGKE